MKEYKELKLKKKIYSIMNCYEKAGNLYQMIESLIQVFVYHHVFERSCRWQVLEMTKYTVKLISARGKPRLTEFEYMIGKSEKTFESVIITLLLCISNQKQPEYL